MKGRNLLAASLLTIGCQPAGSAVPGTAQEPAASQVPSTASPAEGNEVAPPLQESAGPPAEGSPAAPEESTAEPTLAGCAPPEIHRPPERIDVTLELDAASYRRTQSVGMTLRVKNLHNTPFRNQRSSSQRAVFWVISADRVVWRSDVGEMFTMAMEEDTWTAGEAKTESVFWTGKRCNDAGDALVRGALEPGTYSARGGWRSGTRTWGSAPVEFRVR